MNDPKKDNNLSFEQTLMELESIVEQMEQGDLPLDKALNMFEKGVSLANQGQQTLKNAEQKVQILMQDASGDKLDDLQSSSESEE